MHIDAVHIVGYRNFVDATFRFDEKTLIVGGNDVGKTNLLRALRILFDPALSAKDLQLSPQDFSRYSDKREVWIAAQLVDINEDCLRSALGGAVVEGCACVAYGCASDGEYRFYVGCDEEDARSASPSLARQYIRSLQLEYVAGSRDFPTFLKRQQSKLLELARAKLEQAEADEDDATSKLIQSKLDDLNTQVGTLHYIADALRGVNDTMGLMSLRGDDRRTTLVAGTTDAGSLLSNLSMQYEADGVPVVFGGEGTSNQLYFATWLAAKTLSLIPERVIIYAIEEPEAHLHPQRQRALSSFLVSQASGQFLMTTHSPQIASAFTAGRIMRLVDGGPRRGSYAMGCSAEVDGALASLGFRVNAISSELFFAHGAVLVEGQSEELFYRAVGQKEPFEMDRNGIVVINVGGVGFKRYAVACHELGIPFVVRTDNDYFKIPRKDEMRAAGVERCLNLALELADLRCVEIASDEPADTINRYKGDGRLRWSSGLSRPPKETVELIDEIREFLDGHGIYLAGADFETDLCAGPLGQEISGLFDGAVGDELVERMKGRKAESAYAVIGGISDFSPLADDRLLEPLCGIVGQCVAKPPENSADDA